MCKTTDIIHLEYKYTKEWVKVKNTDDLVVDCRYNTSKYFL